MSTFWTIYVKNHVVVGSCLRIYYVFNGIKKFNALRRLIYILELGYPGAYKLRYTLLLFYNYCFRPAGRRNTIHDDDIQILTNNGTNFSQT